ncbi:MAG: hypothetical protein M1817_005923 [Caeruleum heppii]|nr:MAG: hypothetical protein M1817_005923 [Caeruleum heppii]
MPRVSQSSLIGHQKNPKARRKASSRSLDAYSIASHQTSEAGPRNRARLGQAEDHDDHKKRKLGLGGGGDDSVDPRSAQGKRRRVDGEGDEIDRGSDSDGNTWQLGAVNSSSDSEIDSDEALGQSDVERFAFKGSSSRKADDRRQTTSKSRSAAALPTFDRRDLSEGSQSGDGNTSASEDDESEAAAMDLIHLLDASTNGGTASENQSKRPRESRLHSDDQTTGDPPSRLESDCDDGDEDEFGDQSGDDDDAAIWASASDDEQLDTRKLSLLQDLVTAASGAVPDGPPSIRKNPADAALEARAPSEFGLRSSQKLSVADMLPSVTDADLRKSLKVLSSEAEPRDVGRKTGIPGKLEVPLAKRQQDRLDRDAAYKKSKETLARWLDTVKHNRRAPHLSFPLADPDTASAQRSDRLQPVSVSAPYNELETTIQSIMRDSGLGDMPKQTEEDIIQVQEESQLRRLRAEDAEARRAQLRMARELLFREEVRAKRIKKIKSKVYRRVHRKEREKAQKAVEEALQDARNDGSEGEVDDFDRRRAEERMGTKHRDSAWAKEAKRSGRTVWDESARASAADMARKGEELRKRIEGKSRASDGGFSSSGISSDDSDDELPEDIVPSRRRKRLAETLEAVTNEAKPSARTGDALSRLSSMPFMQKAEAMRKMENDLAVADVQRGLVGSDWEGIDDGENGGQQDGREPQEIGRRTFGAEGKAAKTQHQNNRTSLQELEEVDLSNDSDADVAALRTEKGGSAESVLTNANKKEPGRKRRSQRSISPERTKGQGLRRTAVPLAPINGASNKEDAPKASQSSKRKERLLILQTASGSESGDEDGTEEGSFGPSMSQQALRLRAFAGDDVDEQFEKDKTTTVQDEEEKVIDDTLPGWGQWTGVGLSKKEQRRNQGRFLTKVDGISGNKRADAKLERVIINEKRVKKNSKYLASNLPHPFETRQQYERSLRVPVGPEWTTKETFQSATKPRILLKQGVIAPMRRPLL